MSVLRDEAWWRDWAKRSAESETDAMFLAWDGDTPVGVTDGNDAARVLYERYGFAFNGVANPLREGEPLIVREMTLSL